jgi:ABC-type uncharacterized transport system auxiliary subunit
MNANFKKYISIALTVCLLMALVSLAACKDKKNPEETTPEQQEVVTTTVPQNDKPQTTTPKETTPAQPTETVTFPSDEEVDPKQEDVFFE